MKERIAAAIPGWVWAALKVMGWGARALAVLFGAGLLALSAYFWIHPLPEPGPLWLQRLIALVIASSGLLVTWDAWGDDGVMPRLRAVLRDVGVAARDRMIAVVWIALGGWSLTLGGYVWISMLDPADSGELELTIFGALFATGCLILGPAVIHEALKDLEK